MIKEEQTSLLIKLWNKNYSSSEIAKEFETELGFYISESTIKARAQRLIKIGLLTKREHGWNMKCKRGLSKYQMRGS